MALNPKAEAFYQKIKSFAEIHDDMPDGAFFALAEEQDIDVEDWAWFADEWERRKDTW